MSSWVPPVWFWQFLLICLHPAVPSVPLLLPQADPHVHPCPAVTWETVAPVFLQQRRTEFIYVPAELKINPNAAFPRCSRQKLLVSGVCDYFYTNSTSKHSKPGRMIIRGIKSWIPSNEVGFSTSCSNVTSSRQLHWSKMAPDISLYFHIVMNKSRPGNFKEGRWGSSLQKRGPLSRFRPVFPTFFHEGGRLKDEKIWFAVFVSNLDSLKTFARVCPKRPSGDSLPPVAGNRLQHVSFLFLLTEATATLILIRSYLFTSLPTDKQQLTPSATGSLTPPSGRVTNIPIKHR